MQHNQSVLHALRVVLLTGIAFTSRADWPEFRGPAGDGHAAVTAGLPLHWSETNNIKWKTEIPFKGWSTPVVMNGQVWVTTATEDGHDFFAIVLTKTYFIATTRNRWAMALR